MNSYPGRINGPDNFPQVAGTQCHMGSLLRHRRPPSTAIPTSAWARAGESLIPFPTTATT